MYCASSSVRMPVMRWRVVCALRDVILTFWPTSAFISVDLPTLGRPTMATMPQRNPGVVGVFIFEGYCATTDPATGSDRFASHRAYVKRSRRKRRHVDDVRSGQSLESVGSNRG